MLAQAFRGGFGPVGIAVMSLVGQQDVSLAELVRQCVGLGAVGSARRSDGG